MDDNDWAVIKCICMLATVVWFLISFATMFSPTPIKLGWAIIPIVGVVFSTMKQIEYAFK